MREGDTVTIIEHGTFRYPLGMFSNTDCALLPIVSADWLKCRDSQGQEGLVPTAYVQQL